MDSSGLMGRKSVDDILESGEGEQQLSKSLGALSITAMGIGAIIGAGIFVLTGTAAARRDWVLCLEAGDVPAEGWIRTLDRFIGTARPETGLGRLHRPADGWLGRVVGRIEILAGARQARAGDVVRREALRAGAVFAPRLKVRPLIARIDRA